MGTFYATVFIMMQNRHKVYSMCRFLQCTSCIAAVIFILNCVEFTLKMLKTLASIGKILSGGGTRS